MNDRHASPSWSSARWVALVLLLAAAQTAVVLWFTRWPRLEPEGPDVGGQVRWEPGNPEDGRMGDPRQFSGVDPAGFSGAAARAFPPPGYALAEWNGRPRWLGAAPSSIRLGVAPAPVPPSSTPALRLPAVMISGELRAPRLLPAHTVVSPRGALAHRGLQPREVPVAPPGVEVLGTSVIEVGVHPDGEVVLARVTESSGNPEADLRALAWSREARFLGTDSAASDSRAISVSDLAWGQLAFLWRVEPSTP